MCYIRDMKRKRVVIIGAAGRDFHNFNVVYRNDPGTEVVAFTATQIPGIAGRRYPASLAGKLYPDGIAIEDEQNLETIIRELGIDECVFSYSDIPYNTVMNIGARVMAAGADFSFFGPKQTMLKSLKPVIAVVAVRTGCGKSQTSRRVIEILREAGKRVFSVRHPMPYGDLKKQAVQRFAAIEDLKNQNCTIEEMEEYEPHIAMGSVIYAGVDYEAILRRAEEETDVIVWDGGNNDTAFYKPDLTIVVTDPYRPGHELTYYPGSINFLMGDVIVVNKTDSAPPEGVAQIIENASKYNPSAKVIKAESVLSVDDLSVIQGKRVLVIEDGPTLTHGEMKIGAGVVAAQRVGVAELVDPRPYVSGTIRETFERYPNIGVLLPAMGYGEAQMKDLEDTINRVECDAVVVGTPIDLGRFLKLNKPATRVRYNLSLSAKNELKQAMSKFLER